MKGLLAIVALLLMTHLATAVPSNSAVEDTKASAVATIQGAWTRLDRALQNCEESNLCELRELAESTVACLISVLQQGDDWEECISDLIQGAFCASFTTTGELTLVEQLPAPGDLHLRVGGFGIEFLTGTDSEDRGFYFNNGSKQPGLGVLEFIWGTKPNLGCGEDNL